MPEIDPEVVSSRREARSSLPRDETGGSVYLRLSTCQIEQPGRKQNAHIAREVIDGATWLKEHGDNANLVIAYLGTIGTEAIAVAGSHAEILLG